MRFRPRPQQQPGITIPDSFGAHWRARRNSKATVSILGDSITQGLYSSALESTSFFGRVRSGLQGAYGNGGSGYKGLVDSTTLGFFTAGLKTYYGAQAGDFFTLTGTWTSVPATAVSAPHQFAAQTVVNGGTLSVSRTGSTITLYTMDYASAGTFRYRIDGGSWTTVTPGTANAVRKTSVTGLSTGAHTVDIEFTGTTTTQGLQVNGVSGENAAGVVVHKLARSGWTGANFIGTDTLGPQWHGGRNMPCDVLVYALMANEAAQGIAADTWALNAHKFIMEAKNGSTKQGDTDIVLVIPHIGTGDNATPAIEHLAARAHTLARHYGAAVVDMNVIGRNSWNYWSALGLWGEATNPAVAGTDSVHPNSAGHALYANAILAVLNA